MSPHLTVLHREETAFYQIRHALNVAGCQAGEHHRGSGWSDEGNLEYVPPQPGYVVVPVRAWEGAGREVPFSADTYHWAVDHAGKGRRAALATYAMALGAARIPIVFGRRRYQQKFMLIIDRPVSRADGRWHSSGGRA